MLILISHFCRHKLLLPQVILSCAVENSEVLPAGSGCLDDDGEPFFIADEAFVSACDRGESKTIRTKLTYRMCNKNNIGASANNLSIALKEDSRMKYHGRPILFDRSVLEAGKCREIVEYENWNACVVNEDNKKRTRRFELLMSGTAGGNCYCEYSIERNHTMFIIFCAFLC